MTIYESSEKIYELDYSLDRIADDDGKEREDYTPQEILDEAKYVLSCYHEGGHVLNYELTGEDGNGAEEMRDAKLEVAKLKRFITKWS
jgi:hypothetical protein